MNICQFSKDLLEARTLSKAGLYDVSAATLRNILKSLNIGMEKTNDRKKLSSKMIEYIRENCNCLIDIKKSKHFFID